MAVGDYKIDDSPIQLRFFSILSDLTYDSDGYLTFWESFINSATREIDSEYNHREMFE